MKKYNLDEIKNVINLKQDLPQLLEITKKAFIHYSNNAVILPPPQQIAFTDPKGDCHIKSGYIKGYDNFCVKIVTGFYDNASSGDGVLLICSAKTGHINTMLYDQGYLTTLRTAIAACLAVSYTPYDFSKIGIIGTGKVASQIVEILNILYPKAELLVYGRNKVKVQKISTSYSNIIEADLQNVIEISDVIITATSSQDQIITDIPNKPLHIIALGTDEFGKQELSPELFAASSIIVDSIKQTSKLGECQYAINQKIINCSVLIELGRFLCSSVKTKKLIITDLIGLAVQDIAIANFVMLRLRQI